MSGKWYVGATPNSDSNEIPKSFADFTIAAQEPTSAFVLNKIKQAISSSALVTPSYVNTANGSLAKKTAVDAADALFVPTSALNAANGVAGLDSSGNLLTGQIPSGVPTEFTAQYYDLNSSQATLFLNDVETVNTSDLRELRMASIAIPDPGYPWRPLGFATVQGGNPNGTQPDTPYQGTNTFGLLTILPPQGVSDQVYSAGICTDTFELGFNQCIPYATANQTPQTVPPILGSLELDLCGSCWTGSGYQYTPAGILYWVLVTPAM